MKYFFNRLYRLVFCRKGFGIHSPFVYDLITNVIEENREYYVYKELRAERKKLKRSGCRLRLREREHRLLFRIANRFRTYKMLVSGSDSGLIPLYLTKFSNSSQCTVIEPVTQENNVATSDYDLLFIDFKYINNFNINEIINKTGENAIMIFAGIDENAAKWHEIASNLKVSVTVDLQNIGLAFFNPALPHRTYKCVIPSIRNTVFYAAVKFLEENLL